MTARATNWNFRARTDLPIITSVGCNRSHQSHAYQKWLLVNEFSKLFAKLLTESEERVVRETHISPESSSQYPESDATSVLQTPNFTPSVLLPSSLGLEEPMSWVLWILQKVFYSDRPLKPKNGRPGREDTHRYRG